MRSFRVLAVVMLWGACGGTAKPAAEAPAPATTAGASAEGAAGQSYAEAMRLMCDAPDDPSFVEADASMKATKLDELIKARVTNQEAMDVYASLADKPMEQKRVTVVEAASKAEIAECRFAEVFVGP